MKDIVRHIENLNLRPFTMKDDKALFEIQCFNRNAFDPFMPIRNDEFFTLAFQRDLISTDLKRWDDDQGYAFAVTVANQLVGRVALSNVVRGAWQNATLGYWIDARAQGQGIATAAVQAVLQEAFGPLNLHRVQAAIMPHNQPSIRVVLKNGFVHEGLSRHYLHIQGKWQDHEIYAHTVESYAACLGSDDDLCQEGE